MPSSFEISILIGSLRHDTSIAIRLDFKSVMKVAVVHNPTAGRSSLKIGELLSLLRDAGHQAEPIVTSEDLPRAPEVERADLLVIAGGDGTLRKVALQFVGHSLPLAVLPIGTANNISKSLGIVGEPAAIIASWTQGQKRKIDVGCARGPWGERLFLEGIGIGLVGRSIGIVETIDQQSTRTFTDVEDTLQRDLAVFVALAFEFPSVHVGCTADGLDLTDDYLLLEILNIRHVGPRIELAPEADPSDGLFDVVFATSRDRESLKKMLLESLSASKASTFLSKRKTRDFRLNMLAGELRIDDEVVLRRDRTNRIKSEADQIDISVMPKVLQFLVPKN